MGAEPARSFAPRPSHAEAWSAFWEEQGPDSRCLAEADSGTRHALAAHWSSFAARLAPQARVLDLGCGGGVVGRGLLAVRDDLRITGIDAAAIPLARDRRMTLLAATRMERLPFGNEAFDAAVSQFGLEYGEAEAAAAELARVLVPGAPVSFLVHHKGSAIARRSLARRRALRSMLGDGVKRAFRSGRAAALDRELRAVVETAPAEPIVAHVAQALRQKVGRDDATRAAVWRAVAVALAPERALLGALEGSCIAPEALAGWLARLARRLEIGTASLLCRPDGEIIAWRVEGARPGQGPSGIRRQPQPENRSPGAG